MYVLPHIKGSTHPHTFIFMSEPPGFDTFQDLHVYLDGMDMIQLYHSIYSWKPIPSTDASRRTRWFALVWHNLQWSMNLHELECTGLGECFTSWVDAFLMVQSNHGTLLVRGMNLFSSPIRNQIITRLAHFPDRSTVHITMCMGQGPTNHLSSRNDSQNDSRNDSGDDSRNDSGDNDRQKPLHLFITIIVELLTSVVEWTQMIHLVQTMTPLATLCEIRLMSFFSDVSDLSFADVALLWKGATRLVLHEYWVQWMCQKAPDTVMAKVPPVNELTVECSSLNVMYQWLHTAYPYFSASRLDWIHVPKVSTSPLIDFRRMLPSFTHLTSSLQEVTFNDLTVDMMVTVFQHLSPSGSTLRHIVMHTPHSLEDFHQSWKQTMIPWVCKRLRQAHYEGLLLWQSCTLVFTTAAVSTTNSRRLLSDLLDDMCIWYTLDCMHVDVPHHQPIDRCALMKTGWKEYRQSHMNGMVNVWNHTDFHRVRSMYHEFMTRPFREKVTQGIHNHTALPLAVINEILMYL